MQNTSSNAIKGLVSGLLTDVCGVNVEIRGACRVLSNGLLLDDLLIGTDMTVTPPLQVPPPPVHPPRDNNCVNTDHNAWITRRT